MRLGQLTADDRARRSAPAASTASRRQSASRRGDSKNTHVRGSAASVASQDTRAECLRGANPSKQNLPDGRPDTASAVVTADGPGRQLTGRPALDAGRHQPIAGSLISGMPASLTSRTVAPASISSTSAGTRDASFCVVQADHLAGRLDVERLGQGADPAGVLGGDHVGARQGADQPRGRVRRLAQRRGADEQSAGGHRRAGT